MRSKIVPESLAERLALWAGKVPLPVVETIFPLLKARSLMAAERLGIFEALRDAPLPPTVLASELGLDEESLRLMLGVLVGSGYLAERAGQYRLARGAKDIASRRLSGMPRLPALQLRAVGVRGAPGATAANRPGPGSAPDDAAEPGLGKLPTGNAGNRQMPCCHLGAPSARASGREDPGRRGRIARVARRCHLPPAPPSALPSAGAADGL